MRVATAASTRFDGREAIQATYMSLLDRLGGPPQILFLHASASYDGAAILEGLRELAPGVVIHGATSCLGVMTETRFESVDGFGLGLLGIVDPDGTYGVGGESLAAGPRRAAATATRRALAQADRPGEVPDLVWLTQAPGHEELVLQGVEDVLGSRVPVMGGSSADNDVSGKWKQFANHELLTNGVAVAVLFPSTETLFAFHSGYEPTERCGRVTRADHRTLREIDGQPAARVYDQWTGGLISSLLGTGGRALNVTTLQPLGRVEGSVGGVQFFRLSHPETVTPEHGLTLFTDIAPGDQVVLMRGTEESLLSRAGRVARGSLEAHWLEPSQVAGALIVYCAGCMLAVRPRMAEVVSGLRSALGDKPFLGAFTFGEQGRLPGGRNCHGNLMISVLIFSQAHGAAG